MPIGKILHISLDTGHMIDVPEREVELQMNPP